MHLSFKDNIISTAYSFFISVYQLRIIQIILVQGILVNDNLILAKILFYWF